MNKDYDYIFKVVLVGSSSVGKSSILKRFADGDFNQKYLSTVGVDFRFKSLQLNGKSIKLQVWDTAGQQRFKSLAHSYYKGAHAVVLVYDIEAPDTFDQIKKYWLKQLKDNMDYQQNVFIAANKCDDSSQKPSQQQQQFLQLKNIKLYKVSAKQGINVKQMFQQITMFLMKTLPPTQKKSHESIIIQSSIRQQRIKKKGCCK